VLYSILIEFGIPTKLVRLIKMCLNETCSKVHIGKHLSDLSDNIPIQNDLKDCLCGLVVRVSGYRSRGPGFDS
jgi:hypothetical protein